MIHRNAMQFLAQWKESKSRKPLIIRGARQVGKTTLIREFAKQYEVFLDLNLEKPADRQLFEDYQNVKELITSEIDLARHRFGQFPVKDSAGSFFPFRYSGRLAWENCGTYCGARTFDIVRQSAYNTYLLAA